MSSSNRVAYSLTVLCTTALLILASAVMGVAAGPTRETVSGVSPTFRAGSATQPPSDAEIETLLEKYRQMRPSAPPAVEHPIKDMTAPLAGAASALTVRTMPGSDFAIRPGEIKKFTWMGRSLILWGRVMPGGGSGSYTATWDPGDGSGPQAADASHPNYIYLEHVYATFGPRNAVLRVTDVNTGQVASASVYIEVDTSPPPQQTSVNAAIEDGLRFLYLNQDGPTGFWSGSGGPGTATALALSAFEMAHHQPTDSLSVYADRVRLGLEAMIGTLTEQVIGPQMAGDPDVALVDGLGVRHTDGTGAYSQGIMMLALALSRNPDAVAGGGPYGTGRLAGWTYRAILADMVDQLAFSQTDADNPGERGGWRYDVASRSYGSDNSAVQWASIGLAAATEGANRFFLEAAPFVKTELGIWLATSQCADGGFGYTGQFWSNCAKTGSGIFSHYYIGTPRDSTVVTRALAFLDAHWCDQYDSSGYPEMFNGNFYALYAVKKALDDYQISLVGSRNWVDYMERFLVKGLSTICGSDGFHQVTDNGAPLSDGNWQNALWLDPLDSTAFALLILLPGAHCDSPIAVATATPRSACPGEEIRFDGTGSTPAPGNEIQTWEWDFGDGGPRASGPVVTHTFGLKPDSTISTYMVSLTVADTSGCPSRPDVVHIVIGTTNHPPVPVPGGPYTACVCDTIRLNACRSFDPDRSCTGDSICMYLWDLDADGHPDYRTTECVPDTFLLFCQEVEKAIQLRVVDCRGDTSSTEDGVVRVWSSIRELSVLPPDLQLKTSGCELTITATIHAATQVPATVIDPATVVVHYDDSTCADPAKRICSRTTPPMVNGDTFTFTCTWTIPDLESHKITVFVDPEQLIHECVETDNAVTKPASCITEQVNCKDARPSVAEIWPPNHQMVNVSILGVTSSSGGPVTITITGITQDEPLDAGGDGHFEPDGAGVNTSTAQVRAERAGTKKLPGNGRVYRISFKATGSSGVECDSFVTVCVPHDQGQGRVCVDDGQKYNSMGDSRTHGLERSSFHTQLHPNPFNPSTTITYALPEDSHVRLVIYDALGRKIRELANSVQAGGEHSVQWDGRDASGLMMPSGVYLYRLKAGKFEETKRMLLMK